MDWKIIIILIVATVIYGIVKLKEVKVNKGHLDNAQRLKPNVLHDISQAIESIISSVHYLDPLAAKNILAQTSKDVKLGENTSLYCFEVRTKKYLEEEEISDFKERLQRELNYIRQNRKNLCSAPLIVESIKPFATYAQIVVKTRR